jgi:cytochrome c oxidase subunit 1
LWVPRAPGAATHVSGLSAEDREGLVTTVLDAVPDVRYSYPAPTIWPLAAACGVMIWLVSSAFWTSGLFWGLIPPAIAFIGWYWPSNEETARQLVLQRRP